MESRSSTGHVLISRLLERRAWRRTSGVDVPDG
jgi:hypothetical protein